jgi:hypothetical protein
MPFFFPKFILNTYANPFRFSFCILQVTCTQDVPSRVFTCTCSVFRSQHGCLHTKYAEQHWDDHSHTPAPPSLTPSVTSLHGVGTDAQTWLWVGCNPATGEKGEFVRHQTGQGGASLQCCSSDHRGTCWHTKAVDSNLPSLMHATLDEDLQSDEDENPAEDNPDDCTDVDGVVPCHYHWPPTPEECKAMDALELSGVLKAKISEFGLMPCAPNPHELCKCGVIGHFKLVRVGAPTVYFETGPPAVVAMYKYKSSCGNTSCDVCYDGRIEGLFVSSNKTVLAARILYKYAVEYEVHGMPQETFHTVLSRNQELYSSTYR